jgi:uncharacterized membrane protein
MAYCSKCGGEVQDGVAFCPKCGQAQVGGPVAQTSHSVQPGIAENVAGLLCYVLGWVTGIIFFLIDKRPYVRFHAAQSIVVFGGLHVINIVIGIIFGAGFVMMGGWSGFGLGWALYSLISLAAFVLWILLMVKAYQGEKFQVPVAGGIAQSFAGK